MSNIYKCLQQVDESNLLTAVVNKLPVDLVLPDN